MAPDGTATAVLADVFGRAVHHARLRHGDGARVVAASWPTVPGEIVRAAGFFPWVVRQDPAATPLADARLERGVFSSRVRLLIEAALDGRLDFAELLVLPRTSEQDYKAFLYLQEFARQADSPAPSPPSRLLNLLQWDSPESRAYGEGRLRALGSALEDLGGSPITPSRLADAIRHSNRARQATRAVLALRRPEPRIPGAEALALLGAFWLMPHEEYADLAVRAVGEWAARPVLPGPRLLLAGASLDHSAIHRQVEAMGAVVTAETSPWGSGVAGRDIDATGDPFSSIIAKYVEDVQTTRLDARDNRRLFEDVAGRDIDGVIFVIPDDDSVVGWDYPAQRSLLDARGIPHARVRGSGNAVDSEEDLDRVASLIAAARRRAEATRG